MDEAAGIESRGNHVICALYMLDVNASDMCIYTDLALSRHHLEQADKKNKNLYTPSRGKTSHPEPKVPITPLLCMCGKEASTKKESREYERLSSHKNLLCVARVAFNRAVWALESSQKKSALCMCESRENCTYLFPRLIFSRDSLAMTWPQGSIMGGLASVPCSLLTGQTKMEWNR